MRERPAHESEDVEIVDGSAPERVDVARALLDAYADWVRAEPGGTEALDAQGFDEELASLPGAYASPTGALLLILVDGVPAGCIALRRIDGEIAEVKRLFVTPDRRGMSLGWKLIDELLSRARALGYSRVRLDTMPFMRKAAHLYRAFDFVETEAYSDRATPGARFFERSLDEG